MKHLPTLFLIFISILTSSCNAQVDSKVSDSPVAEQQQFIAPNARLRKTLGSSEHQNIHCSLQDKRGNLWFGSTGEGVYRYDGKEFTQFTTENGLSSNCVWSILEDTAGNIWFGTDDGLSMFDGKSFSKMPLNTAYSIGLSAATPPTVKNPVWSLMQDKSGIIWIGTSADLYCYDGNSYSRFLEKANLENNQNLQLKYVQCMLEDGNGTIWFGSGPIASEGVIRFKGKSIESSKPNGDGWIRHILEDKRGNIWFSGRQNGVFVFDGQTFTNFTEKLNIGSAILADNAGNIWFDGGEKSGSINSDNGIWRFDASLNDEVGQGKSFKNYTVEDGLLQYSVWSILEDNYGHMWIGTRNSGLSRFDGKYFVTFSE